MFVVCDTPFMTPPVMPLYLPRRFAATPDDTPHRWRYVRADRVPPPLSPAATRKKIFLCAPKQRCSIIRYRRRHHAAFTARLIVRRHDRGQMGILTGHHIEHRQRHYRDAAGSPHSVTATAVMPC